tara:strand:- start:104 stop:361 length:258 start_codon:yes stop_codon:yes gene_type:complete
LSSDNLGLQKASCRLSREFTKQPKDSLKVSLFGFPINRLVMTNTPPRRPQANNHHDYGTHTDALNADTDMLFYLLFSMAYYPANW